MANSNLPDPPLKHVDLITDLDAIDTSIAEGAQWLDRNAPVNGVADRKGFVGFCTGLKRFVDESHSAGHVPPNIHNMLTDLSEQLGHYTADYAEWCFEGVESGSDWQAYSYREHLQTAVTELRAETEVEETSEPSPTEPTADSQGQDSESGSEGGQGEGENEEGAKSKSPAAIRSRMTWQRARSLAEKHVKRHGNKFPGVRPLAKIVNCCPSTMSKVVKNSSYLTARQAEQNYEKTRPREVQMSNDQLDSVASDIALNRLIRDQGADQARENHQHTRYLKTHHPDT